VALHPRSRAEKATRKPEGQPSNKWLQASDQSLPAASTTRPSFSKNLFGIWKMAMKVPPFGE